MVAVPYLIKDVLEQKGLNGLTVAGSFSGCGGSSLGWALAGFSPTSACEFDPHAAKCYSSVFPDTAMDTRSVSDVTAEDILEMSGGKQPDVWEGSPPCSKFSTAGTREKGWGKVSSSDQSKQQVQNVEDLFFEWLRLLEELRPRAAVAENVTGMLKGASKGYAAEVLRISRQMGYRSKIWQLNASSFGVPQIRRRIFFVMWDSERCDEPRLPEPEGEVVSAEMALDGLLTVTSTLRGDSITDINTAPDISRFRIAEYASTLNPGQKHHARFTLGIAHPDRPFPTLGSLETGSAGMPGPLHWSRTPFRKLSIAEYQRIASFPDDYPWPPGTTWEEAGLRLGNVVPPLMARAVARSMCVALSGS